MPAKGEAGRLQPSRPLTPSRLPNKSRPWLSSSLRVAALLVAVSLGLLSTAGVAHASGGSGSSSVGPSGSRWGWRSSLSGLGDYGTRFSGSGASASWPGGVSLDVTVPDGSDTPMPTDSPTADSPTESATAPDSEASAAPTATVTATETATATATATVTEAPTNDDQLTALDDDLHVIGNFGSLGLGIVILLLAVHVVGSWGRRG